jgi:hypothetical protein
MDMSRQLLGQLLALGGVHPLGSPEGPSQLRAECLIAGTNPRIEVTVRFIQAIERQVLDAAGKPVEDLLVTGRRYSTGDETDEREVRLSPLPNRTAAIRTAGAERAELTENGAPAGALEWRWEPLHSTVEAWTEEVRPGLTRVLVEVANRLEWDRATPEQNLMRTLHSTRVAIRTSDSAFSSSATHRPGRTAPAAPL